MAKRMTEEEMDDLLKDDPVMTPAEEAKWLERGELREKVTKLIHEGVKDGRIKFELNGHYNSGKKFDPERRLLHEAFFMLAFLPPEDLKAILNGTKFVRMNDSTMFQCWECNEYTPFEFNGTIFRVTKPCQYPDGVPAIEFDLNVPSGKMVVANDLRGGFRIVGDFDVNAVIGSVKTSLAYANVGMAHCFVGNTCPGMYHINGTNRFVIGVAGENKNPVKNARRVASICTDLWWFSIVDADEYERRYNKKPDEKEHDLDIVKCEPGVYRFKHVYHRLPDQDAYPAVYTRIRRIGKPRPVRDFLGEWNALNYTAGQIIADAIQRHPLLYNCSTVEASVQRVADAILCMNGNGYDPHPNGWFGSYPAMRSFNDGLSPVEIPDFYHKYHWYPISDYSYLAAAAGLGSKDFSREPVVLNDSFLDLAFKICRSIIVYGMEGEGGEEKKIQRFVKKCLEGLKKKYPDKVPENCRFL